MSEQLILDYTAGVEGKIPEMAEKIAKYVTEAKEAPTARIELSHGHHMNLSFQFGAGKEEIQSTLTDLLKEHVENEAILAQRVANKKAADDKAAKETEKVKTEYPPAPKLIEAPLVEKPTQEKKKQD